MNRFKAFIFLCFAALALLCSCQHGIEPDDLDYPTEFDDSGFATTQRSEAEVQKELEEIHHTPYPPYRIQGGDIFRIKVYNEKELDSDGSSVTMITPDGYIAMVLAGPVKIGGLTIIEATQALNDALKKYVKFPNVGLIPQSVHGATATLLGAVTEPGNYVVSENTRLSDFIVQGRGYRYGLLNNDTVNLADISNSYVIRDGKILPINFNEALVTGNQLHNIKIFPKDIVYIATREDSRVVAMGEVMEPRTMNWTSDMTIIDVIAKAGGLREEYWGTALVLRKNRKSANGAMDIYKVELNDLFAGRAKNFRIASGDIVYVPKDSLSEYNIFIRKLIPTAQLINLLMSPPAYWFGPGK